MSGLATLLTPTVAASHVLALQATLQESPGRILFEPGRQQPALVSFYQEDCHPCRVQAAELRCLQQAGWSIVGIGLGQQHLRLKQEWLRHGKPGPLVTRSFQEARTALGVQLTPTVWWNIHPDGPWFKASTGPMTCPALLQLATLPPPVASSSPVTP